MSPASPAEICSGGESSSIVECIAEAFDLGATLQLRHLARGTSFTSRTLLRLLHNGGPERLSLHAAATGVSGA